MLCSSDINGDGETKYHQAKPQSHVANNSREKYTQFFRKQNRMPPLKVIFAHSTKCCSTIIGWNERIETKGDANFFIAKFLLNYPQEWDDNRNKCPKIFCIYIESSRSVAGKVEKSQRVVKICKFHNGICWWNVRFHNGMVVFRQRLQTKSPCSGMSSGWPDWKRLPFIMVLKWN